MATIQSQLVCDSSTLTNFKAWGQGISSALSTMGFVQASDTGQVNWSTIAAVPGSNAYVFEIWKPNDTLTNYYFKIEYGNVGTNGPSIKVSLGIATDGAGTLTGTFVIGPLQTSGASAGSGSASTQYECDFHGAAGRFAAMLWRNGPTTGGTACQQIFALERSLDSSGAYTGEYITLWTLGYSGVPRQQTLHFTSGPSVALAQWISRGYSVASIGSNGAYPFDNIAPCPGFFGVPCTVLASVYGADVTEALPFGVKVFGSSVTYLPSKLGSFANAGPLANANFATCMRFD